MSRIITAIKGGAMSAVDFVRDHLIISGIVAVAAVGVAFAATGEEEVPTFVVSTDSFVASGVSVSGTVKAHQEVELGFDAGGRIAFVGKQAGERVAAGEVLARLSAGDVSADLLRAQADLDAEVARLNELKSGGGSLTEVATAKAELVRQLKYSYIQADDAIRNKVDQVFIDLDTSSPEIRFAFDDRDLKDSIDRERATIETLLDDWKLESESLSVTSYTDSDINQTKANIDRIRSFLDDVAQAVNRFVVIEEAGLTQSVIDKYRSDVATARSNMNSVLSDINKAEESVRGIAADIPYQEAKVKAARASVQNYQAQLAKSSITAPFAGVVTRQDAKVGMNAGSGEAIISLISDSSFEIETYVPEVYVAQIKVGNKAKVTLDAYDDATEFMATVASVDPAATDRDGVATYKVKLAFDQNDDRIKAGMTASVTIETDVASTRILVPQTAIIDRSGSRYAKVKAGDAIELRAVTVGVLSGDNIEVTSGLAIGDEILLEPGK